MDSEADNVRADSVRFPSLAAAAALTIEVIQGPGETIFVPRCRNFHIRSVFSRQFI